MGQMARVAVSSDFLGAFAKLPQGVQSKVSKFLTNFQRDPTATGINYERINAARDTNMRSVRIDDAWRGIVLRPEQGNIYLLLWVDRHDDAYAWAARHRCTVHELTGAIQVFEAVPFEEPLPLADVTTPAGLPGLFDSASDRELGFLGVPDELLPQVRRIHSEEDLDALQAALPAEAYEGLFLLAAGDTIQRILGERETRVDRPVDPADFSRALDQVETQSRFVVVDNETELAAVLNASLAQWRIFLHPSQRRVVQGDRSGPVRVLGGAGTGKTVVAMHRAKWLAESRLSGHQKVLFTTFTRNLAVDIQSNLKQLCSPETMSRIEVINLDAWVRRFLQQRDYAYEIVYDTDQPLWDRAMTAKPMDLTLPDTFYREEWRRVIQPQAIQTLDDYRRASRIGRGTTLTRAERAKIWPVFEEYVSQMTEAKKKEVDDAYRDAASLLSQDRSGLPYAAVIVDEAQDMGPQAFRLLRAIAPAGVNDLFIVGDGHQRIYGRNKVVLSKCGIDIRGRARKLRINYRTTEEIRCAAVALLEGYTADDLDGEADNQRGYKSLTHGSPPVRLHHHDSEGQADAIAEQIRTAFDNDLPAASICVVARTRRELEAVERQLKRRGFRTHTISGNEADGRDVDAIRLATMHRVKGLEFDLVLVVSVNEGLVPLEVTLASDDPVERATTDMEERCLLYVALTRARKQALMMSYGKSSHFLI